MSLVLYVRTQGTQAKIFGGYDNSQFIIDWDAHTVTYPQGQTTTTWTPGNEQWGNAGINVKFSRERVPSL